MHDRRREIEGRLARALDERLRPAVHTTVAPLTVEVWHVPRAGDGHVGEPVPFAVARDAAYLPCDGRRALGPGVGYVVVPAHRQRAGRSRPTPRPWWTSASPRPHPGFQAEGLVHEPDGRIVKGLNPRNDWIPARAGEPSSGTSRPRPTRPCSPASARPTSATG